MEKKKLLAKKELYMNKLGVFMFESAIALAVPALTAVHFIKKLDKTWAIPVLLGGALALSWSYILWRYKKITGEIRKINEQLSDIEQREE